MQFLPHPGTQKTKDLFHDIWALCKTLHISLPGIFIFVLPGVPTIDKIRCERSEAAHPPTRNEPPLCIPDYLPGHRKSCMREPKSVPTVKLALQRALEQRRCDQQ